MMEEGHYTDLCEALHNLADEIDAGGSYEAKWVSVAIRELVGTDTRKKVSGD